MAARDSFDQSKSFTDFSPLSGTITGNPVVDLMLSMALGGPNGIGPRAGSNQSIMDAYNLRQRSYEFRQTMQAGLGTHPVVNMLGGMNSMPNMLSMFGMQPDGPFARMTSPFFGNPMAAGMGLYAGMTGTSLFAAGNHAGNFSPTGGNMISSGEVLNMLQGIHKNFYNPLKDGQFAGMNMQNSRGFQDTDASTMINYMASHGMAAVKGGAGELASSLTKNMGMMDAARGLFGTSDMSKLMPQVDDMLGKGNYNLSNPADQNKMEDYMRRYKALSRIVGMSTDSLIQMHKEVQEMMDSHPIGQYMSGVNVMSTTQGNIAQMASIKRDAYGRGDLGFMRRHGGDVGLTRELNEQTVSRLNDPIAKQASALYYMMDTLKDDKGVNPLGDRGKAIIDKYMQGPLSAGDMGRMVDDLSNVPGMGSRGRSRTALLQGARNDYFAGRGQEIEGVTDKVTGGSANAKWRQLEWYVDSNLQGKDLNAIKKEYGVGGDDFGQVGHNLISKLQDRSVDRGKLFNSLEMTSDFYNRFDEGFTSSYKTPKDIEQTKQMAAADTELSRDFADYNQSMIKQAVNDFLSGGMQANGARAELLRIAKGINPTGRAKIEKSVNALNSLTRGDIAGGLSAFTTEGTGAVSEDDLKKLGKLKNFEILTLANAKDGDAGLEDIHSKFKGKGDWAAIQSAAKKIAGISGADEALANNDSFNAKDLTKKLASAKIMEGRLDSPAYAALALKSLGITDEESKWYTYKDGKNVLSGGGIDSDRLKSDSKWIRESIAGMGGKEEDNLIYKYGNEVGGAYEKELKLAGLALGKDDSNEKKDPIKELIDVLKNIFGENGDALNKLVTAIQTAAT